MLELRLFWILPIFLSAFACTTVERHLCDRSAECDVIEEGDVQECIEDLEDAIDKDRVDKKDVRECVRCMEDNDCGVDIALDCSDDCENVAAIVVGSRVH